MSQAIAYLTRGTEISEYNAALILASGSRAKAPLYEYIVQRTDYTVSLHLRSVPVI